MKQIVFNSDIIEIIGPAFIAGLMIALTHALLGIEVIKRGIIFIDLAIAQIAGLGLIVSSYFFHDPHALNLQLIALSFAFMGGIFFYFIEKITPEQQEAIIASSFVLSASIILLLLSNYPHGGERIQDLLSGQLLFITWHDVLMHAPIYGLILALWLCFPWLRKGIGFYLIFAFAITSSVQLVGVYVVFASLILPALAAIDYNYSYPIAWLCGIMSVCLGILISIIYNLPSGPVTVVCYTGVTLFLKILHRVLNRHQ